MVLSVTRNLRLLLKHVRREVNVVLQIVLSGLRSSNRRLCYPLAKNSQMHRARVFNQVDKTLDRSQRPWRQQSLTNRFVDRAPHRRSRLQRDALDGFHRGLANASRRHVDHALQRDRVVGISEDFQIRDHVLDLGAFVETEASHNVVVQLVAAHRLFDQPRLRVRSIQDRRARCLAVFGLALAQILRDEIGGEERFVLAVGCFVVAELRAALPVGPEILALALDVARHHRRCRLQDVLRRAIILLQANDAGFRKILLELQDVANVRAAPGVDALVLIADGADVVLAAGEHSHQLILRAVRVLILVDQEVTKAAVVALARLGGRLQHAHRVEQQSRRSRAHST